MLKHTMNLLVGLVTLFSLIAGTAETARAIIWDAGGDAVSWSDPLNWDTNLVPVPADDVFIGAASNVDASFIINSLTQNGAQTLSSSGGSALTVNTVSKTVGGATNNVPFVITAPATFNAVSGGGWSNNRAITGAFKVSLIGPDQVGLLNSGNTFNALDINSGNARFVNGGLGTGPINLGAAAGAANAGLFPHLNGSYTSSTNTVTVKSGTGTRQFVNQTPNAIMSFPLVFALEKDLRIRMGDNDSLSMTGNASGVGGFEIVDDGAITTPWQLNLDGAYSYTGTTTINGEGAVSVNGSMATGKIDLTGTNDAGATLNGTGTIFFNDGDLIDVNALGTLDASTLQFDLTALTTDTATLVDYSDSGSFTGPGTLNDLLNTASQDLGWVLENTGTQINAFIPPVPEPSTLGLLVIGLVGASISRRRRKATQV